MITPNKIFTLGMIINYIQRYYPELKFWDGIGSHEPQNPSKVYKHRQGMPNEIRIEFDNEDRSNNWSAIMETGCNLWRAGYSFAVFFVEGGRSPHIHLYNIDEMNNLTYEQRTQYRKLFLGKFCPEGSNPDYGLTDERHLCALEFAIHFKYNKIKQLLHYCWRGWNQGCEYDLLIKVRGFEKTLTSFQQQVMSGNLFTPNMAFKEKVEVALTFEKIFGRYGIKYRGTMACCPFHNDTNFSLAFNNEKKMFHCFGTGCNIDGKETKGKILTLIKLLEKGKHG